MAMSDFLLGVSWRRHRLQSIVIVQSFLRLLNLHKQSEDLISGGGVLLGVPVLDHGLNLCQNIPLKSRFSRSLFQHFPFRVWRNMEEKPMDDPLFYLFTASPTSDSAGF